MNRILTSLGLAILILFLLGSTKTYCQSDDNLTDSEKSYILGKLCTEVKYNFVFYNDLEFDWDSLCNSALPNILKTNTYNEFVKELQLITTKLNDGHTFVKGNSEKNRKSWVRPLPMQTKRIGNQVFVTQVLSSELENIGVTVGSEVLKVNDIDVIEYGEQYIQAYTSSSTPQYLEYFPFSSFELTKGTGIEKCKILFKNKDGKTVSYESDRISPNWDIDNRVFDFQVLKDNVGYLKINTFDRNDFTQFDEVYNEIIKTDKLVIDLRDNNGGNSNYANYILSHLTNISIPQAPWSSRMYIATHGSWNYPQEWYIKTPEKIDPINKNIYSKPIVVLTNSGTFSSSENFCSIFKGMNRGLIIGSTTGGSTGNPISIDLGYGIAANICTRSETLLDGTIFIGKGIEPDVRIEETYEIYSKNNDVVLKEALHHLKK